MKYLSWLLGQSHWLTKPVRKVPHVARRMRHSPHRHNVLGSFVVVLAIGILYVHAHPTTAGTEPLSPHSGEPLAEAEKEFNNQGTSEASSSGEKSGSSVASNDTPTLTEKAALTECVRI